MKKITYIILFSAIVSFLFISCEKDDEESENPIIEKELTPSKIQVTQNGEIIEESLKDGIITLEQGKKYHIEITFDKEVDLVKGDFLKFKEKNKKEYYADFYGRNLKEIIENTVFKKQGHKDWALSIKQGIVIPDHYVSVKTTQNTKENSVRYEEGGKVIWLTNMIPPYYINFYGENYYNIHLQIDFPAPVFVEDIKEGDKILIKVESNEELLRYKLSVATDRIRKESDYSITMPIFGNKNGEKGEKLGEIILKSDFAPYMSIYYTNGFYYKNEFNLLKFMKNKDGIVSYLKFNLQGTEITPFIENINTDYIKEIVFNEGTQSWNVKLTDEKKKEETNQKVHAFDIFEGITEGDKTIKKEGASKREIFLVVE